jgi:hypothetical protein
MTTFEDLATLTISLGATSDEQFAWQLLTSRRTEHGQEYVSLFRNAAYILANPEVYTVDADGKGYEYVDAHPAPATEEEHQQRLAAGNALLESFRDDIEAMYQDALRADTANRNAVYGR